MNNLTEKQQQAFSLKFEYELGLAEIALRMGLDRKTVYEHIEAAKRRIDQARSNEKRKAHRPTSENE
jgi:DNA-directed RNA polymerase specialized sigma24 family protein